MVEPKEKTARKQSGSDGRNSVDLTFEPCIFGKAKVWLPVDLIEDPLIFKDVLSQKVWDSSLSDEEKEKLLGLMPSFPDSDEEEKKETLRMLFDGDNFKFGNPLATFQERLRAGFMNPEIAELEQAHRKATYQDYRFTQQRRLHRLLKEVLISRQELLEAVMFTSPSAPIPVKRRLYRNDKAVDGVVNKKYKKMLASSKEDETLSESSDEDEFAPEMNGHQKGHMDIQQIDAMLEPKWTDYWPVELDAQEETHTHSTFDPKPASIGEGAITETGAGSPATPAQPIRINQQQYIKMLEDYQDRMEDEHLQKHPDLNTKNITLMDIVTRAFPKPLQKLCPPGVPPASEESPPKQAKKRKDKERDKKKRKKKKMLAAAAATAAATAVVVAPPKPTTPISTGSLEGVSPVDVLSTPESRLSTRDDLSISPATCSPASAGSMGFCGTLSDAPSSPDSRSSDIKPPLRVHPSFFSLVRDIFSAAPNHRLTLAKLRESLANWQRSPVSMLSNWAVLQPSWAKVVDGAMKFLNGEISVVPEVIPRVRYDEERHMWQWRSELPPDSEEELVTLFKQWLDTLPGMRAVPPQPKESSTSTTTTSLDSSKSAAVNIKTSFAEQERERYSQPHKAFVYRMPGYSAIVGPVKGVFGKETTQNKAREHALLVSDRPPYVTILSLVRDAVARLPNGEGTRAAVCELLKDSQYLAESSDGQINNVVSGALDRLHYEKDPCIKYDVNRKLWIYLHRDRTKEEFERLHQEQAAEVKARKSIARQTKLLPKMVTGMRDSPISFPTSRPGSALSDTSSESLSIEVVSPKASPGRAASPKQSRKSPAFMKTNPVGGFLTGGDSGVGSFVTSGGKSDPQGASISLASTVSGGKVLPGTVFSQAPFLISPQKMGSLQSALRGLHQAPASVSSASSDSFIKAQLLAAKSSPGIGEGGLLHTALPPHSLSGTSQGPMGGSGDVVSKVLGASKDSNSEVLRSTLMKSMSVPCTLPDGKVVMITPSGAKKKRARSGSGGRKRVNSPQIGDLAASFGGLSEAAKSGATIAVTPSAVTVSQGVAKQPRKGATATPSPLTIGATKLTTVSEALALKRAEAALQSGRQQSRGHSTITLPHGALKGQTVKSILASVGMSLSNASVTVSKMDTPGTLPPGKQSNAKMKDNRKSSVFSMVNLLTNSQAQKGRPASAPTVSGTKSPVPSMQHTFGHQTIGLTTVTKGGQIVVQPVALGIDRPRSASSPASSVASTSQASQSLTIKAMPVGVAKQQVGYGGTAAEELSKMQAGDIKVLTSQAGVDEHDGSGRSKPSKKSGSKRAFTQGQAAAALAQAKKAAAANELKDFTSVPLSVLLPGARPGGLAGIQKGALPFLTSPFLPGGQIPLSSLTDGKGVIFQMPPGSNIMSLPMSGVPNELPRSGVTMAKSSASTEASVVAAAATSQPLSHRLQPVQIQLTAVSQSPTRTTLTTAAPARGGSPALPPNIVTATIRSALAAAQSRSATPPATQHKGISSLALGNTVPSIIEQLPGSSQTGSGTSVTKHTVPPQSIAAPIPASVFVASHMGTTGGPLPPVAQSTQSPALSRPPMTLTTDAKTTPLSASSIASIIANLKQNPMAAISLPPFPTSAAPPPPTPPPPPPHPPPRFVRPPPQRSSAPKTPPRSQAGKVQTPPTFVPPMTETTTVLTTAAPPPASTTVSSTPLAPPSDPPTPTVTAPTTPVSPAPVSESGIPVSTFERIIPPIEARITRGKTKGKDKSTKKDT
ncbi:uncharacterized protein [Diadema antillarum]|uniref:uncharacterized protein n=1 Tax=Diadema antillarum TaxID=105358 RepID=UPI003A8915A4